VIGEHGGHLADQTVVHGLVDDVVVGQEPAPHAFEHEQPVGSGEVDQVAGLGGVAGERLLHQDGFTRFEGEPGLAVVLGVGRGDVDDVDVRVVDEFVVGAVGGGCAVLVGEGAGPVEVAGSDGGDPLAGTSAQRGGELPGDPAGSEDAPA